MNNTDTPARDDISSESLTDLNTAKAFYDARYSQGYMSNWPNEKCVRVAEILQELPLPLAGKALDFGCGTAVFTSVLKHVLCNWEICGTDISENALEIASQKLPDCFFHKLDDLEKMAGQYDLVFTHHVLEHVADLRKTASMLSRLLSPSGTMLHILPSADPGSLEHGVCIMRKDGMIGDIESRFFYDEDGHLRRLGTQGLLDLWSDDGFSLERAYYANQKYGGIRFITENDLSFILDFTDPRTAVNSFAAVRLLRLRLLFVLTWAFRKPTYVVKNKIEFGCNGFRDYCVLALGLLAYPASKVADWCVKMLARREWQKSRHCFGGSEMYIFLRRTS